MPLMLIVLYLIQHIVCEIVGHASCCLSPKWWTLIDIVYTSFPLVFLRRIWDDSTGRILLLWTGASASACR